MLDFKTFQKKITPELYSFAFALIPDDLQAMQIVIDANLAIAHGTPELLAELHAKEVDEEIYKKELNLFKTKIYKEVFELSRRRAVQLSSSLRAPGPYHKLSTVSKASLFLKHKAGLSLSEISEIMGLPTSSVSKEIIEAQEALLYPAPT